MIANGRSSDNMKTVACNTDWKRNICCWHNEASSLFDLYLVWVLDLKSSGVEWSRVDGMGWTGFWCCSTMIKQRLGIDDVEVVVNGQQQ